MTCYSRRQVADLAFTSCKEIEGLQNGKNPQTTTYFIQKFVAGL